MEKIIGIILQHTEEDKFTHLQGELNKLAESLTKSRTNLEEAIVLLDSQKHTYGKIFLMSIIASAQAKPNREFFISQASSILLHGNIKQVRIDPKRFSVVCRKFVELCREAGQSIRAIKPLKSAISKIAPENHLTPQHAMLCLACISSKCYKAALSTLDNFVFLIDPKGTGLKSEDTRLYFYYGGMCYAALKKWEKAIQFFETVISAPAMIASAIMIEAYKKYVLASLIHRGEVKSFSKSINPAVVRNFKQLCVPYDELEAAFQTQSIEDVTKAIENNLEPFTKDNNFGLVGQVKSALLQQNIKKLTRVYSTISYTGIAESTGIDIGQIETKLLKMVETSNFSVKIHQQQNYVEFLNLNERYDDDVTVNYLSHHIKETIVLHKRTVAIDRSIERDEKYVQRMIKSENNYQGRAGGSYDNFGASMQGRGEFLGYMDEEAMF